MAVEPVEMETALQRLEQSEAFAKTSGLLPLLRFLIEHADSPDGAAKETYIGAVFYGRQGTYDPRYDSIVRVSVKRLRERLIEYYATEGKHELQRIVPLGTYSAVLEALEAESSTDTVDRESATAGDLPQVSRHQTKMKTNDFGEPGLQLF